MINQFFQIIGMLTCALLVIWLIARLYYGKQWHIHLGLGFFAGPMLIKAIKKLYKEFPDKIERDTLAEVTGQVIIRLTRIGLIGLLVAVIPIWLLMQQNGLLQQQNDKFDLQNDLLKTQNQSFIVQNDLLKTQNKASLAQNDLSRTQNEKFDLQNSLLGTQNESFLVQNNLSRTQNEKFDLQNERLNLQNNLLEADRRSSLVFLMSNVLDKVDEEIREQKKEIKESGEEVTDSTKYSLSKPLVNRIIALSKAFSPYRMMEGDNLSDLVSPERGQLFIALMENNLDSITQNTIANRGDFSRAIIGEVVIPFSKLRRADLRRADLSGADLRGADLSGAYLRGADFWRAKLSGADLRRARLNRADLRGARLNRADLRDASLGRAYLWGANLWGAYLWGADLSDAYLSDADLSGADLRGADLSGANLWEAELSDANLSDAELDNVKNITTDQLKLTRSLYQCKNLNPQIKAQLEKEKPCLFTEEGCPEE